MRPLLILVVLLCHLLGSARGQEKKAAAGEAPGPWIFGTIGVGQGGDAKTPKTTALKGVALKLGQEGEAAVAYDLDLCRVAGAWTGGKLTTPMNLMSRGEYPTAMGKVAFTSVSAAGFQPLAQKLTDTDADTWKDPRAEPYGPLVALRYRGLFTAGDRVVLKWEMQGVEILESPSFATREGWSIFTRSFQFAPTKFPVLIALSELAPESYRNQNFGEISQLNAQDNGESAVRFATFSLADRHVGLGCTGLPTGTRWQIIGGQIYLQVPPLEQAKQFSVSLAFHADSAPDFMKGSSVSEGVLQPAGPGVGSFEKAMSAHPTVDFAALLKGGPARWPETVETKGEVSALAEKDAYVVDTITLPEKNPWKAPLYVGGFDFLPDGRAVVCTFHGDVFIASGLDANLEHLTWRRFATGLYHALGCKVVNGEIYITERSGITRLRDLNKDGEADFYEAFNWDVKVTKNFHEFVFDLQTDPAGNFFLAKAGPVKNGGRGFDEICEHHGTLLRVSPDGKKLDVYATGFRAPNGIGVGPEGQITSGDNEGTWTPVCRLNWITQSGFYGCVPTAHQAQPPSDYVKPLCWLPKRVDNSSGSQVWVTSNKWGPWQGQMLHLSYGTCTLFGVMMQEAHLPEAPDCCQYVMQGGVTAFPVKFQSGIMRARFHPGDGQLYVAGLRGWQTTGAKNGTLQRVRYTGQPVRMPIALTARKGGIEVKFTSSLDTQQACDPENWNVEVWNYLWSSAYGSPEISTLARQEAPGEQGKEGEGQFTKGQMSKTQHDPLTVKSVSMGTDDRTVFLEIPDLKPVMQMVIKYQIKAADGVEMKGEVVNTIHGLGE